MTTPAGATGLAGEGRLLLYGLRNRFSVRRECRPDVGPVQARAATTSVHPTSGRAATLWGPPSPTAFSVFIHDQMRSRLTRILWPARMGCIGPTSLIGHRRSLPGACRTHVAPTCRGCLHGRPLSAGQPCPRPCPCPSVRPGRRRAAPPSAPGPFSPYSSTSMSGCLRSCSLSSCRISRNSFTASDG